jgi:hypothetical protein
MEGSLMQSVLTPEPDLNLSAICHRYTLGEADLMPLPQGKQTVYVQSGVAWISLEGQDFILTSGETTTLWVDKQAALASSLSAEPLLLITVVYPPQPSSLWQRLVWKPWSRSTPPAQLQG